MRDTNERHNLYDIFFVINVFSRYHLSFLRNCTVHLRVHTPFWVAMIQELHGIVKLSRYVTGVIPTWVVFRIDGVAARAAQYGREMFVNVPSVGTDGSNVD